VSACTRCGKRTPAAATEACWFCDAPLCRACWGEYGHCGHAEADAANRAAAMLAGPARAVLIMTVLDGRN